MAYFTPLDALREPAGRSNPAAAFFHRHGSQMLDVIFIRAGCLNKTIKPVPYFLHASYCMVMRIPGILFGSLFSLER
jgi:hypothetical protein